MVSSEASRPCPTKQGPSLAAPFPAAGGDPAEATESPGEETHALAARVSPCPVHTEPHLNRHSHDWARDPLKIKSSTYAKKEVTSFT